MNEYEEDERHGTTIVGILTENGVVIGSDRKTSVFISTARKDSLKIKSINSQTLLSWAGAVSDAQNIHSELSTKANIYEARREREMSVKAIVNSLHSHLREEHMHVSPIIGGFDEDGPQLYDIGVFGTKAQMSNYATAGSGGNFAMGVLEAGYRPDLTIKEAKELAKKAIKAATERDNFTGNGLTIGEATKDGVNIETYSEIPEEI